MIRYGSPREPSKLLDSELLCEVAPLAFEKVQDCVRSPLPLKNRGYLPFVAKKPLPSPLGSRISGALYWIAGALERADPFQLSEKSQELSRRALNDCLKICKWPAHRENKDYQACTSRSSRDICDELKHLFFSRPEEMREGIRNFLGAKKSDVQYFASRFQELVDQLVPENRKLDGEGQKSFHREHFEPEDGYIYPDFIRENLITALRRHAMCVSIDTCHPIRLCLSTKGRNVEQWVEFEIVMSPMDFDFWQDFLLGAALSPDEDLDASSDTMRGTIKSSSRTHHEVVLMDAGDVCRILETQRKSRSSLLHLLKLDHKCHLYKCPPPRTLSYGRSCGKGLSLADILHSGQYNITPRLKIMLSFAVARTFWEFYGSGTSTIRWCSEEIWFMPYSKKDQANGHSLEPKAFVSFSFGQTSQGPDEFLEINDVSHAYPQILSLGIVLLEVMCCKKLDAPTLTVNEDREELANSVSDAHSEAAIECKALHDEKWELCKYKRALDIAISNCLDPSLFNEKSTTRKQRSTLSEAEYATLSAEDKADEDQKRADHTKLVLKDRREAIYQHVVSYLYWLERVGNDDSGIDMLAKHRLPQSVKYSTENQSDQAEITELWQRVQKPTFDSCSSGSGQAEKWFEDIRAISVMIYTRTRMMGIKLPPVRVAILDTGYDPALKYFESTKCFRAWHDFAAEPPSQSPVDGVGHGTFMARLVMQIIPGCELYVARIAQTREQLESNEKGVIEALKHAAFKWKVDVISMSFGFPRWSQTISDTIQDVRKARDGAIILLASVGNDINREEAYPACDSSVISMYATASSGAFLPTSPFPSEGPHRLSYILGTYGDNVPDNVLAELRAQFPNGDFSAGTSIATAVAAGIVGLMLAYAALMPYLPHGPVAEYLHNTLRTTEGMRCMLVAMAKSWGSQQYFINPVLFWSSTISKCSLAEGDIRMFFAIGRAMPSWAMVTR